MINDLNMIGKRLSEWLTLTLKGSESDEFVQGSSLLVKNVFVNVHQSCALISTPNIETQCFDPQKPLRNSSGIALTLFEHILTPQPGIGLSFWSPTTSVSHCGAEHALWLEAGVSK